MHFYHVLPLQKTNGIYVCLYVCSITWWDPCFYENHGQAAPSSTLLYKVIVKVIQQVVAPWLRCHPTLPPRWCLYLSVFAWKVFFWKLRQPLERSFCCSILWAKFLTNVSFTQNNIMHPCAILKMVKKKHQEFEGAVFFGSGSNRLPDLDWG